MSADSIKAGGAVVTIGADTDPLSKAIEAAKSKIEQFGDKLSGIGKGLLTGAGIIGGIGAAITAPFAAGLAVLVDAAGPISSVARQTGLSFEQVQDAAAGFRLAMEDIPTVIAKMSSAIVDARDPSSAMARNFRTLGLNVDELAASDPAGQLQAIGTALAGLSDTNLRMDLTRAILGNRGLRGNFGGDIQGRIDRNREIGGVMSNSDIDAANAFSRAQNEAKIASKGLASVLGAIFAPIMQSIAEVTLSVTMRIRSFVDAHRTALGLIARVGVGLIWLGSALGIVGGIMMGAGKAMAVFWSVWASVSTFFVAAGGMIAGVFATVVGAIAIALPYLAAFALAALGVWLTLKFFGTTLYDVYSAIKRFVTAIITGIDWIGVLTVAVINIGPMILASFMPLIVVLGIAAVSIGLVVANFYLLYQAAVWLRDGVFELARAIGTFLVGVWDYVAVRIRAFINYAISLFPQFFAVVGEMWSNFVGTISFAFNEVRSIVSGGVSTLVTIFGDIGTTFGAIGDSIAAGDWSGAFDLAMTGIKLIWERTKNFLLDSWYRTTFVFGTAWDSFVQSMAPVLAPVVRSIIGLFYGIVEGIQGVINSVIDNVNAMIARIPRRFRPEALEQVNLVGANDRQNALDAVNNAFAPGAPRQQQFANRDRENELAFELERRAFDAENQRIWNAMQVGGPARAAAMQFGSGIGSFNAGVLGQMGATNYAEQTATACREAADGINRLVRQGENEEDGVRAS